MGELFLAAVLLAIAFGWFVAWVRRCKRQRSYIMDAPSVDCIRKYVS